MTRNILNIMMTIAVLLIMDYRFTGNAFHEIAGVILAVLVIYHNVLNCRWYEVFFKGRQSLARVLHSAVNWLLLVTMIVTVAAGLLISQMLLPLFVPRGGILLHELHQAASYASLILAAIHIGFHWEMLMAKLRRWLQINSRSRVYRIVSRLLAFVIIVYGVYASFSNHIGAKFFMQHAFMGWGEKPSLWGFLVDYLAIMGCYVGLTHYALRLLRNRKNKRHNSARRER